MFCIKCGSKITEGADFCHVCGTKVLKTEEIEKENISSESNSISKHDENPSSDQGGSVSDNNVKEPSPAPSTTVPAYGRTNDTHKNNEDSTASRYSSSTDQYSYRMSGSSMSDKETYTTPARTQEKPKHTWVIVCIIAAVVIIVIFIISNWSKTDYIETVKQHRPFASYEGYDYTIGEVFDKYVDSPSWNDYESNNKTYVKVTGTLEDFDSDFCAIFHVEPYDDDYCTISLESISIGTEKNSDSMAQDVLLGFFDAYSKNYKSIYDYIF